jgi:predicted nucleic-acid-binding Zn-ribbon protein
MSELFECKKCGSSLFEKKAIGNVQLTNPFMPTDKMIMVNVQYLVKCVYCGSMFSENGTEIDPFEEKQV